MKLVWHAEGLLEQRWLRDIFRGAISSELTDRELTFVADNSIHVISSNVTPLRTCADYFERCRRELSNITLVHLSDELFDGGYEEYGNFDRVIRQYPAWFVDHPGIAVIPVGYSNDGFNDRAIVPAGDRKNLWSFVGAFKSSRWEMAGAMKALRPYVLIDTSSRPPLDRAAYSAVLSDSVFAPCPMGNVLVEAAREYEAMELGCIPIVETRRTLDYHRNLLGENPIPAFHSWRAAARYCKRLMGDRAALEEKQDEIVRWWRHYKADLRASMARFLAQPSHSQDLMAFAMKARNRVSLYHEAIRVAELLRHQTGMSFLRRIQRPIAPLSRLARGLRG